MLTRKQYELLVLVDRQLKENGISPSFDEMKEALGLRSKSGIHRLITALEERGFIRRLPHRARALEVIRLPENAASASGRPRRPSEAFAPNVIKADFRLPGSHAAPASHAVQLPLYGRIAAGTPIEALRDQSRLIDIPSSIIGKGDHYALEIDGDSMIEAGILDGDIAIIQQADTADNGEIVVAQVHNEKLEEWEVTLKRFRRRGKSVALEPANSAFETRICGPDQVKVQGRLVGLYRRYGS